jgi:hypothetical protein
MRPIVFERSHQHDIGRCGLGRAAHLRETDCVAGRVGLELGNVAANYPFERSLTFLGTAEFWPQRPFPRVRRSDWCS